MYECWVSYRLMSGPFVCPLFNKLYNALQFHVHLLQQLSLASIFPTYTMFIKNIFATALLPLL